PVPPRNRAGPSPSTPLTGGNLTVRHLTPEGGTSRFTTLRVPEPRFSRRILDRSSSPSPDVPRGPRRGVGPGSAEGPWLAQCPDDERLHLVRPGDVALAVAKDHAPAVCGQRIAPAGFTVGDVDSGALCMACVIAAIR